MKSTNLLFLIGCLWVGWWLIVSSASAREAYPLTVQTTPTDSRVRILNIGPRYHPGIRLPAGDYDLEVSHEGYQTVQRTVHLGKQPLTLTVTLPVTVELEPSPAVDSYQTVTALDLDGLSNLTKFSNLKSWRHIYSTPPLNAEWLRVLRASLMYWFLSPMTWVWLLIIWWVIFWFGLVNQEKGKMYLSAFNWFGLLTLILGLPLGWLFKWDLNTMFLYLMMSLTSLFFLQPVLTSVLTRLYEFNLALTKIYVGMLIIAWICVGIGTVELADMIVALLALLAILGVVMRIVIGIIMEKAFGGVESVAVIGVGASSVLYSELPYWHYYFPTTALDSLILIGTILLAWLLLGILSVLLSARFLPWLKAKNQAVQWVCRTDNHRIHAPNLPAWPVRWSGRLLIVENPRQHEDFADYFVCRYCGKMDFVSARYIVGIIGDPPRAAAGEHIVPLFEPALRKARSADIDRLELHAPPPGQSLDYDYAVNAVLNALSEDHHLSRKPKQIPVKIYGGLSLPENTRRILADRFKLIEKTA